MKSGSKAHKGRKATSRVPSPSQTAPAPRLRILLAVVVAALLAAGFTWREPLTLAWLRRGPVEGLERYAARHPDSVEAADLLARAYLASGRPADAARVRSTLVKVMTMQVVTLMLLGLLQVTFNR